MLYILTALKPEAQAFVDKFRLKKQRLQNFTLFTNEEIILIVSGLGVVNAKLASEVLLENFSIKENDKFLNIGICGAKRGFEIGELLKIGSINYGDKTYILDAKAKHSLTCLDAAASDETYEIVDMESFGFYDTLKSKVDMKNIYVFKVVSDNFEPHIVTKDTTKSLIFKEITNILKEVKK